MIDVEHLIVSGRGNGRESEAFALRTVTPKKVFISRDLQTWDKNWGVTVRLTYLVCLKKCGKG
jgi:hypothetical protein